MDSAEFSKDLAKDQWAPKKQRVEGKNTFRIIRFEDMARNRWKEICHSMVLCDVLPQKEDPNRTRITVAGSLIFYPRDIGTPKGFIDLANFMINSVLSRCNACIVYFDAKNDLPQNINGSP